MVKSSFCSDMPRPSRRKPRPITWSVEALRLSVVADGLSDIVSGCAQGVLHVSDGQLAEVEHARGEHGIGPGLHGLDEVLGPAGATARDERYLGNVADR